MRNKLVGQFTFSKGMRENIEVRSCVSGAGAHSGYRLQMQLLLRPFARVRDAVLDKKELCPGAGELLISRMM